MKRLLLLLTLFLLRTHWVPSEPPGGSGLNMTLIGVVRIDGVEQTSGELEVGVFHEGECRGADLTNVSILDRQYVFLTIYGINGDENTFRLYDHATETELNVHPCQTILFSGNEMLGSIDEPFVIDFVHDSCEIFAFADPEEGGRVAGSGMYMQSDTAVLTAIPNPNYLFRCWIDNGEVVSEDSIFSFVVEQQRKLYACFAQVAAVGEQENPLFEVFPNPVVDKLIVETGCRQGRLEVFSLSGTKLFSTSDCSGLFEINTGDWPTGAYLVRMISNGFSESRKLIKK